MKLDAPKDFKWKVKPSTLRLDNQIPTLSKLHLRLWSIAMVHSPKGTAVQNTAQVAQPIVTSRTFIHLFYICDIQWQSHAIIHHQNIPTGVLYYENFCLWQKFMCG